jgi:hypothetical protein
MACGARWYVGRDMRCVSRDLRAQPCDERSHAGTRLKEGRRAESQKHGLGSYGGDDNIAYWVQTDKVLGPEGESGSSLGVTL